MTIPETISIGISCIALVISLLTFLLPLTRNRFVIEEPSSVYTISQKESQYDELVVPVICNNYGSFMRSISNMECTLEYDDKSIPMRPFYTYDSIDATDLSAGRKTYSTFVVEQNSGNLKYVGFKYDDTNFQKKDKTPQEFHFLPNKLYVFKIRFYSTRNSFFKNDREIIQAIYGFETRDELSSGAVITPSKQTWFKITDRNVFPAYK